MTRRSHGTLHVPLAVALLAFAAACADARSTVGLKATDCTSCHGLPPAKDAHVAHTTFLSRGDPTAVRDTCRECHRDVQSIDGPDHIFRADGTPVPPPAEVRFDDAQAIAGKTQAGATRAAAPGYAAATRNCSNVYCHGAGLQGLTAGLPGALTWDAPQGSVTCGACHAIPPTDHPASLQLTDCTRCHGDAIDAAGVPSATKHVNGTVDLAAGVATSCATCHGDRTANVLPGDPRSAPPTDAAGQASSAAVGAHQVHLVAGRLGVAVACSECHVVPAALLAAGHLDGRVTVAFGPLARTAGAAPVYTAVTQTCSSVYCHGGFPFSKVTPAAAPTWNAGQAAVACGSCHDLPPPPPAHRPVNVVTQGCGITDFPGLSCHPAPYSPTTVDPKLHIDGKVCPPFCTPSTP